jgi:hypothetical protein
MHRGQDVHFDHQPRPAFRERVERAQERHGGVVDQNVGRSDFFDELVEYPFPVVGL